MIINKSEKFKPVSLGWADYGIDEDIPALLVSFSDPVGIEFYGLWEELETKLNKRFCMINFAALTEERLKDIIKYTDIFYRNEEKNHRFASAISY